MLYRINKLKFLDYTAVNDTERKEAIKRGAYLLPVKVDLTQVGKLVLRLSFKIKQATPPPTLDDDIAPLPDDLQTEGKGSARFGISNYVRHVNFLSNEKIYVGKHSEGNRFITNDNL